MIISNKNSFIGIGQRFVIETTVGRWLSTFITLDAFFVSVPYLVKFYIYVAIIII